MGETLEEIQQPVSPTMAVQSDSEESTESTLGLGPGLSGMDLSGEAEGRGADPKTLGERLGAEGTDAQDCSEGEFSCRWGTCNEFFSHVDLLASHVTCVHATSSENGLFFCGWRGCSRGKRGFNARYKMLIHVRTHTNEKPHRCPRCDKSFSRAENLKIHARSHTGERPYVCPVPGCGKAYSNSSDRFKHTRTHSVERPYACRVPGCLKRYTDPSSLRKHVKTYAHYHRPGSDENSNNTSALDEKHKNKINGRREVDIKSNSSDATPKANHLGKAKNNGSAVDEVNQKNLRNSKSSSAKVLKVDKTLAVNPEVTPVPAEALKIDNLAKSECGKTSNGLALNEDIQECGRLQHLYIKNCSPASWNSVPDDKWLENDIEEVEDDEDASNHGDFQDQESLGIKERYYLSNEVIHGHMGHPALQRDSEWSSGAEEEWMSDESDYAQNGTLTIVDSLPTYLDFASQVAESNQKSYANEKQFIPKLGKKNYILSKSCKQKLDDLLLRSYSKHGSSLYHGVKRNNFPLESFQPMDYSSSHIVHQAPVVDRYKKVMNEMAYHSISYEQVVPLDLRKVN